MGDTIDYIDREMFDLFQNTEGFKHALIFNSKNKYFVSQIDYINNGIMNRTTYIKDIYELKEIHHKVAKLEKKYLEAKPISAVIKINNGKRYKGKLRMFSKKHLYLDVNENFQNVYTNKIIKRKRF